MNADVGAQRKARTLTQRTRRKPENTEKTVRTAAALLAHEIQTYFSEIRFRQNRSESQGRKNTVGRFDCGARVGALAGARGGFVVCEPRRADARGRARGFRGFTARPSLSGRGEFERRIYGLFAAAWGCAGIRGGCDCGSAGLETAAGSARDDCRTQRALSEG